MNELSLIFVRREAAQEGTIDFSSDIMETGHIHPKNLLTLG